MTYKSSILVMLIVLLVGGGLFAYFYKFPKEVNVTREAVTYAQVDPETTESTAIKVEGTMYRPLFRQSTFEGRITIEGKDFTNNWRYDDYLRSGKPRRHSYGKPSLSKIR
ncbi:hypothetical protein BK124_19640 [Paenibacillus amylolyticus]|uniref:hypothetical protein n=1 Tax=Paenibacillus TaxID=44249 RepID=UPI00096D2537|nr:hypothetical protein [Paenibacillus amylolyticus]OME95909.1 hypothetical protein BK124_19640 [Paenibacillus amylolyticus]